MKKSIFGLLLCCFLIGVLYADDYTLPNVDSRYIGTYIPVDVDNQLKKTKLIYDALSLGYPVHHDVLFLGKNKCYSDAGFHDGYAITSIEFKKFRFVENDNGIFCIDDKGNSYRKISDTLNERGYGYTEYRNYVLNVVFDFAKDMKNIQIKGSEIVIDGVEYSVNLDTVFWETENVVLWLTANKQSYALVKNGINGELHGCKRAEDEFYWLVDENVIKEFPLMFVSAGDKLPGYWSLPKAQIRYLRNMIYARHGYVFKSEDLKEIFENFSWYKANPNFKEEDLNKEEKRYIEQLSKREKEVN